MSDGVMEAEGVSLARINFPYKGLELPICGYAGDPYFEGLAHAVHTNELFFRAVQRLPENAVAFDIGANIGLTAAILSRHTKRLYCFEPNPAMQVALQATLEANGITDQVRTFAFAVGAAEGELSFLNNQQSGSASHLITDDSLGHLPDAKVRVTTVDRFVEEQWISRLDFIKMDIEGFEIDALEGAKATIARLQPSALIEFNSFAAVAFRNINPRQLLDFVRTAFPYVYYWDNGLVPIRNAAEALGFIHHNLVSAGCVDDLYGTFTPL